MPRLLLLLLLINPTLFAQRQAMKVVPLTNLTASQNAESRQVGPAFREIAKRGYTPERIVELIYNPEPASWPDYTPMAPMPQDPGRKRWKLPGGSIR